MKVLNTCVNTYTSQKVSYLKPVYKNLLQKDQTLEDSVAQEETKYFGEVYVFCIV